MMRQPEVTQRAPDGRLAAKGLLLPTRLDGEHSADIRKVRASLTPRVSFGLRSPTSRMRR